jgi:hypothetical protein
MATAQNFQRQRTPKFVYLTATGERTTKGADDAAWQVDPSEEDVASRRLRADAAIAKRNKES